MRRLENKRILIFGGSSGIGAATTQRLAEEGADLVITSDRAELDEKTVAGLRAYGIKAWSISRDYTSENAVREIFDFAEEQMGVPDIIICSAGVGDHITEMGNVEPAVMEKVFRINVAGPYLVMQEGVKRLQRADRYGKIIVLGSICSHYTCKNGLSPVYAASKAAIGSLMESTRRQFCREGNKIGFTLICPGTTNTKLVLGEEGEPRSIFMEPDHVAQCIVSAAALPDAISVTDMEMVSVQQDIF